MNIYRFTSGSDSNNSKWPNVSASANDFFTGPDREGWNSKDGHYFKTAPTVIKSGCGCAGKHNNVISAPPSPVEIGAYFEKNDFIKQRSQSSY